MELQMWRENPFPLRLSCGRIKAEVRTHHERVQDRRPLFTASNGWMWRVKSISSILGQDAEEEDQCQ